ncbi:MAG TPA: hypothetical protein VN777_01385 [Terriglobales bacterium]|nr:hypothetical protein [Terriglobales bacterium]
MRHQAYLCVFLVFLGMTIPVCAAAQMDDGVSLGDLARSLRQTKDPKEPAAPNIIDNDNLTQVMDDVEHLRLSTRPMFSFDGAGKTFQMSSPDGTCSLSFNANTTALLSNPYVSQDLPPEELAKLDGPANIQGDTLEVSMYNASAWNVREITVGLTIVRRDDTSASEYGDAKLLPAVAAYTAPTEKRSDSTLLLHLKGSAAPLATTVYREKLDTTLDEGQEWHWAIIEAKGVPASLAPSGSTDRSIPVGHATP